MDEIISKLWDGQAPGIVGMLIMLVIMIKAMGRMMVSFQTMLTKANERSEETIKSLANSGNQTARQYSKDQVEVVRVVTENRDAMRTTADALRQVDRAIAKVGG